MEYISLKKKKDLEEDLSYKIVQRNKRKVEGQFKYKNDIVRFAIASKMGKDGLNDHSFWLRQKWRKRIQVKCVEKLSSVLKAYRS